jgi:hypothetical protein
MIKLNKRAVGDDEKSATIRTIRWCNQHHQKLAGLPYSDDLAGSSGISLEIIAPPGTTREHLEQALREGYRERDVSKHSVVECPQEWFVEANEQAN